VIKAILSNKFSSRIIIFPILAFSFSARGTSFYVSQQVTTEHQVRLELLSENSVPPNSLERYKDWNALRNHFQRIKRVQEVTPGCFYVYWGIMIWNFNHHICRHNKSPNTVEFQLRNGRFQGSAGTVAITQESKLQIAGELNSLEKLYYLDRWILKKVMVYFLHSLETF
jgi:hypothetical protein